MEHNLSNQAQKQSSLERKINTIAVAKMVYTGSGKFIEFEPDVCGFVHDNGTVELIDPINGDIWEKRLRLYYITENTIILSERDLTRNYMQSYIIDRKTFTEIFSVDSEIVIEEDIMYEGAKSLANYMAGLYHTFYDLNGYKLGEIWTDTSRIRVSNVFKNVYMIVSDDSDDFGAATTEGTTSFYYYDKRSNKLIALIEKDNTHYYDNIADGKYVRYNKNDYTDNEILDLKKLLEKQSEN